MSAIVNGDWIMNNWLAIFASILASGLSWTANAQVRNVSGCTFPFYVLDHDNVAISPAAPSTSQLVTIKVRSVDAIGRAISAKVQGTTIDVTLDASSVGLGDPPPGCAAVDVGPFAPGTYTIHYSVEYAPGSPIPRATTQFTVADRAQRSNYQGLWWGAPSGTESGWGINLAHEGDTIVATWFTYDDHGTGTWMVMTAPQVASSTYSGALYVTHSLWPVGYYLGPGAVEASPVGVGTLTFSDDDNAAFTYTITNGGASAPPQTKTITREIFGPQPVCIFGALPNLELATNFTGLWWARPAMSESGWGINFAHQGDAIFASWFTYDATGAPLWLVMTAKRPVDPGTPSGVFAGTLYRTAGPPYFEIPFDPSKVAAVAVGSAYVLFYDGNAATFSYTMNLPGLGPVSGVLPITRETFVAPGTVCQ